MSNKTQLSNNNTQLASLIQTLQGKATGGGGATYHFMTPENYKSIMGYDYHYIGDIDLNELVTNGAEVYAYNIDIESGVGVATHYPAERLSVDGDEFYSSLIGTNAQRQVILAEYYSQGMFDMYGVDAQQGVYIAAQPVSDVTGGVSKLLEYNVPLVIIQH